MKQNLLMFCFIIFFASLFAQENYSVEQAVEYAKKHNSSLLNAEIDNQIARQQVREATSIGFPKINGSLGYNYNLKLAKSALPAEIVGGPAGEFIFVTFGTKHNINSDITLTQLLFDGSYLVGLQGARKFEEMNALVGELTDVNVSNEIRTSYYNALIARESLDILQKNKTLLEKNVKETTLIYENGFVEKLDVDRLKLSLANLNVQLDKSTQQAKIAANLLKYRMGFPIQDSIVLTDNLTDLLGPDVDMIDNKFNLDNRVEIKLAKKRVVLNELQIKLNKVAYLPSLSAFLSQGFSGQSNTFNFLSTKDVWFPSTIVGIQLNVPIFDSFTKKYKTNQAKLITEQKRNELKDAENALNFEYTQAKSNYFTSVQSLDNQKENLKLAESIYNTTLIKYKEGVGSSLELSTAESELFTSQGNYLGAIYEALVAKNALKKALGTTK